MNDENLQEVYYDRYCKTCEHKKLPEEADPCDECLSNPVNYATHKPPSMKICLRSYRDLELTAVRSLPMSIGTIMRSGCLSKTLGSSLTASTHSILSIISGLSSSPRS